MGYTNEILVEKYIERLFWKFNDIEISRKERIKVMLICIDEIINSNPSELEYCDEGGMELVSNKEFFIIAKKVLDNGTTK